MGNDILDETIIAERMTLGSMLLNPACIIEVQGILKAEYFSHENHRAIYEAILRSQSPTIELPMVWENLVAYGTSRLTTLEDLTRLVTECPTSANAEHHAKKVRTLARARALTTCCDNIKAQTALFGELTDEQLAAMAQKMVSQVNESMTGKKMVAVKDALADVDPSGRELSSAALRTGLIDIDSNNCDLFQRKTLTVIAARPRMGKTTLMRHLIAQFAPEHNTAVFTMEESTEMTRDKLVCEYARVPYWKYLRRHVDEAQQQMILVATGRLAEWKLWLTEDPMSAEAVAMECRRLKYMGHLPRVVFVDHLQHMKHERIRGENDATLIGRTVKALSEAAKELDCCIILLAQLNRQVEYREEQRPMLADLRDSGSIEQIAFNVVFLWSNDPNEKERYVYVAKQRNGPACEARVHFDGEYGRFADALRSAGDSRAYP